MADVAFRAVFNPAGTKLAAGGADRSIRIFDVASGKQEILIEDHADWVVGLAWNPDGTRLASASRDKTSKLFNAANGESLMTYSGHGDQVFGVGFSGDGKLIFTAGGDKKIHAWNPDDGAKKGEIAGFGREVLGLVDQRRQDLQLLGRQDGAAASRRGLQAVQDLRRSRPTRSFAWPIIPARGRVAAGSFSGEVRVWNAEDGSPVVSFVAAPGYAAPVARPRRSSAALSWGLLAAHRLTRLAALATLSHEGRG